MGSLLDLAPPATVTDPLNHTTTVGYDTKGNLTMITNAMNKVTTITVNGQGQPLNRETKRMLDAAGRLRRRSPAPMTAWIG